MCIRFSHCWRWPASRMYHTWTVSASAANGSHDLITVRVSGIVVRTMSDRFSTADWLSAIHST